MESFRARRLAVMAAAHIAAVLTVPTASAVPAVTTTAEPAFGVNMSFYSADDTLVNRETTQKLLRDKGVPLIRVPLRGNFDGNPAPIGDDLLVKVMRAAHNTGATPMLILRGPAAGDDAFVLRENLRRIALAKQVFGEGRVYLEFGNESDLAGIDAKEYARTWNAVVPELRRQAPAEYKFVGPVNFQANADYVADFVGLAVDKPDYLSWHEYVCDKANETWEACLADIPKWATHVTDIENKVKDKIGRTLPFFVSEWNVDPRFPSPAYGDAPNIKQWTSKAIAQLRGLGPLFAGAMIYTATDHGDFALIKGETALTHQGEAFFAAIGGGTPPVGPRFDFEDGTTQGWSRFYGDPRPRITSEIAQHGSRALMLDATADGHAAVGTTSGLTGLRTGTTVTYQVWADRDGITVRPFVRDAQHRPVFPTGAEHRLPARQWVTVTWQVPSVPAVGAIGLEVAPGTGTVALDALTW
ncbi:hypothetical protein KIPE111705_15175 [Kibdelosporangium persicum]|uniref:Glycosyl hydrolase catalytic core n=1 Tax=Kibdelosporangium persicum TaxID=2698649 RepID=A0ABX2FDT6_9PSEU|nr:hypothetical protein [Kibdelosporangium persicum]NRN69529.1 hypothetical protein [Kibdelosporangium persicum]